MSKYQEASLGNSYTDLEVWQLAVAFVTDIYRITGVFPRE
ncbi:MAG: four helix bundle protein [Terriglobales bacterium]